MVSASTVIPFIKDDKHLLISCIAPGRCEDYPVTLLTENGDISTSYLECSWEQKLFHPPKNFLEKETFLKEEPSFEKDNNFGRDLSVASLLSQLENVGWDKFESIDLAKKIVNIKMLDSQGRKHVLQINLGEKLFENMLKVDLPIATNFEKRDDKICIKDLVDKFEAKLEQCRDFWEMMAEIDNNAWVLEPEHPTPSTTHRRIAIDSNASLIVTLNAEHPRSFPDCIFLGPERDILPLKEKLNGNLHKWNAEISVLENLGAVLDRTFPLKPDTDENDGLPECGICYASRIDGKLPDKVCDNRTCRQPFHQYCLYEWLKDLPSSRLSFNTIFGECPFCSKSMSVMMR